MAKSEESEYTALNDLEQLQNKNDLLVKEIEKVLYIDNSKISSAYFLKFLCIDKNKVEKRKRRYQRKLQ